jgi:hypothetical protein
MDTLAFHTAADSPARRVNRTIYRQSFGALSPLRQDFSRLASFDG